MATLAIAWQGTNSPMTQKAAFLVSAVLLTQTVFFLIITKKYLFTVTCFDFYTRKYYQVGNVFARKNGNVKEECECENTGRLSCKRTCWYSFLGF